MFVLIYLALLRMCSICKGLLYLLYISKMSFELKFVHKVIKKWMNFEEHIENFLEVKTDVKI